MLLKRHNAIFIHIPKNAGKSISRAFLTAQGVAWSQRHKFVMGFNRDPNLGPDRLTHLAAREFVDLGYMTRAEFRRCYKFAFVRNPWARMLSAYLFTIKRNKCKSFVDFIQRSSDRGVIESSRVGQLPYKRLCMQQYYYLCNKSGKVIVDFIGRFENLARDFKEVAKVLGVSIRLGHENKTRHSHYRKHYSPKAKKLVSKIYEIDIDNFKYAY